MAGWSMVLCTITNKGQKTKKVDTTPTTRPHVDAKLKVLDFQVAKKKAKRNPQVLKEDIKQCYPILIKHLSCHVSLSNENKKHWSECWLRLRCSILIRVILPPPVWVGNQLEWGDVRLIFLDAYALLISHWQLWCLVLYSAQQSVSLLFMSIFVDFLT